MTRRDDYESVTKYSKFLLLFCTVRLIEDVALAERLILNKANHK